MTTRLIADVLDEVDETTWLEQTAELLRAGRLGEIDLQTLAEFLTDMARRDRREVESRLTILIAHVLKWNDQPDQRTRSWRGSVIEQRQELESLLKSGVLRNHAEAVLPDMYARAVERATAETGLPEGTFSDVCPFALDQLLAPDLLNEPD